MPFSEQKVPTQVLRESEVLHEKVEGNMGAGEFSYGKGACGSDGIGARSRVCSELYFREVRNQQVS